MGKIYRCALEPRGYEMDSFGHVNNAVYFNYLEYARWKMLAEEGITLPLLESLQRWPVIAAIEAKYYKPTYMGDQLEVRTECVHHRKASYTFEQKIYRGEVLVFAAKVEGVMVNENGRPALSPPEMERIWT